MMREGEQENKHTLETPQKDKFDRLDESAREILYGRRLTKSRRQRTDLGD
jgi:hypothetical protein